MRRPDYIKQLLHVIHPVQCGPKCGKVPSGAKHINISCLDGIPADEQTFFPVQQHNTSRRVSRRQDDFKLPEAKIDHCALPQGRSFPSKRNIRTPSSSIRQKCPCSLYTCASIVNQPPDFLLLYHLSGHMERKNRKQTRLVLLPVYIMIRTSTRISPHCLLHTLLSVFILFVSFNSFCQLWNDLVQIANKAVVSNFKDRSCLILVIAMITSDSSIPATCWIAPENTDSKVDLRTNSLTGLANLKILRLPAIINNSTGAAYFTAKNFCQIFKDLEVFRLPTPRPPDTRILASIMSTVSVTDLTTSRIST